MPWSGLVMRARSFPFTISASHKLEPQVTVTDILQESTSHSPSLTICISIFSIFYLPLHLYPCLAHFLPCTEVAAPSSLVMADDQLDQELESSRELEALTRQNESWKTRVEAELASSDKFTRVSSMNYHISDHALTPPLT